jgi:methyl halide transferase
MQQLLAPSGILVCLEFPLYKDLKAEGPPWGLEGVYWNLLAEGGNGCVNSLNEDVNDRNTTDKGHFTRVLYYKPERSYSNGKGTDVLSVWAAKNS